MPGSEKHIYEQNLYMSEAEIFINNVLLGFFIYLELAKINSELSPSGKPGTNYYKSNSYNIFRRYRPSARIYFLYN